MPTNLPSKPHSDYCVAFYNASRPHALTAAQQAFSRDFALKQHTVNIGSVWEIFEDWFSRVGLRFRIKMRLYRRIIADARQRRAASYSVS